MPAPLPSRSDTYHAP
uniref:Uncharacterized protein n=1 Tax=Arundo donax TaxID=35708 RepID=A0A0A9B853_ARUDO